MKTLRSVQQLLSKINSFKKGIINCTAIAFFGIISLYLLFNSSPLSVFEETGPKNIFRTNREEIQILQDGNWKNFQIKGVNIGTGYPSVFPNEFGIDQETYYRWFEMIGEMNANTVRVYKIQSPAFYTAFSEYNKGHEEKLYLVQGVDFSEDMIYTENNLLEDQYKQKVFDETFDIIDALHGKKTILDKKNGDFFCYTEDVSEYVLGYILGIEWDEIFVSYLCRLNEGISTYTGDYLYSREDANAFEIFLTEWGDRLLRYEDKAYHVQKLISFCNWPDTDPLVNEIDTLQFTEPGTTSAEKNTEVFVDVEKVQITEKVTSGVFASYNVYPYYPYFLQAGKYAKYTDDKGNINPYRGYLMKLVNHHSYPVIIAEYGIPSSRSTAYADSWRNMPHGGLNETEQGLVLLDLYEDIQKAGCAGSIVFSWQDEWYKKVWNEQAISNPDRRAFWSNTQSAEQFYGLLSFDPGNEDSNNYPDGNLKEWSEKDFVMKNGNIKFSMKSDAKYVYFLAEGLDDWKNHGTLRIALDITPKSGASEQDNIRFDLPVDFVIEISPNAECRILVQEFSDLLLYSMIQNYANTDIETVYKFAEKYNLQIAPEPVGNNFTVVSRASGRVHNMQKILEIEEVGRLKYGNANPNSPDYDSNADYFITDNAVEIRIPWQLLNFYDPSKRMIIDDYHENNFQIKGLEIKEIYAAAYYDDQETVTDFGSYELESWDKPEFHERLKEAYYMLQKAFEG